MTDRSTALPLMTRRRLVQSALATWSLPLLAVPLAACGDGARFRGRAPATRGGSGDQSALLLPLTGATAAVGQNMARAASLVTEANGGGPPTYDTSDSPEGAIAAARQALGKGAKILFGPLKSAQAAAVLSVAGRTPVVTFSNDDSLAGQGAFVMGVTPAQSVATMFSFARDQGLSRIALVAADSPLGVASAVAARQIAAAGGITLTATLLRDPGQDGLVAALRAAGGGDLPQAVFLPDGGAALVAFASGLAGARLQILGSVQWGIDAVLAQAALKDAWFAAPPPDLFQPFADRFQAAFGESPGVVAGLGYDAALIAVGLGEGRGTSRRGLTRDGGFTGVLGAFRFLENGSCLRDLSVLGVSEGTVSVLAEVTGS